MSADVPAAAAPAHLAGGSFIALTAVSGCGPLHRAGGRADDVEDDIDDANGAALGDAQRRGDVTQVHPGVVCDAGERPGMAAEQA